MRIWLVLAFMSLLAIVASADEDVVSAGPYQASFDMGGVDYKVDINRSAAAIGELDAIIEGSRENEIAGLNAFLDYDNYYASDDAKRSFIEDSFSYLVEGIRPQFYKRTIDGEEGVLGVGDLGSDLKMFYSVYSKPLSNHGSILVGILSFFPWDQGTEDLLNTIKVEYNPRSTSAYGSQYGTSYGAEGAYGTPYGMTTSAQEAYGTSYRTLSRMNISEFNVSRSPYFQGNKTGITEKLTKSLGNMSA